MEEKNYDQIGYYTGAESAQFAFYQLPKELISNTVFSKLSMPAKILYSIMLDRMHLSFQNNWIDENNRVYIIMTLEEICKTLGCGKDKACELLAELDCKEVTTKKKTITGIGLIERKKRGLGHPDIIYPKKYTDFLTVSNEKEEPESSELQTSEISNSGVRKNRTSDFGNPEGNNTHDIETEKSEPSILPSCGDTSIDGWMDHNTSAEKYVTYEKLLRDNTDTDLFAHLLERLNSRMDQDLISPFEYDEEYAEINPRTLEQIIGYMVDLVASKSKKDVMIYDTPTPREIVKSRLLKVDHYAMRHAIKTLNTNKCIRNPRNYVISLLYNEVGTRDMSPVNTG